MVWNTMEASKCPNTRSILIQLDLFDRGASIGMASSYCNLNSKIILPEVINSKSMDGLVSDLTHALDESQMPQYNRKRRGFKRRSKISNTLGLSLCNYIASEDSSSSIGEVALSQDNKSSIPLTDSDDMSPPPESRMQTQQLIYHRVGLPPNLVESDSVNECFPPIRPHNKRKLKCKRMALDPDGPSTSTNCSISADRPSFHCSFRKRKNLRPPDNEVHPRFIEVTAGKRKRGREWENSRRSNANRNRHHSSSHCPNLKLSPSQTSHIDGEEYMDLEYSNESNISSSESEAGIYTCDEGREADDEQSDWFAEPGAVYGIPGAESTAKTYNSSDSQLVWWNDENISLSPTAKAMFKEKYEKMSQESQHTCRLRFQKLRERLLRREIRAGRRRLQERRPGFSIISSVNDKVSRFLQNPSQTELRLKPMTERDRDQLMHLATLYSLNVKIGDDLSAPILTKTRNTITTKQLDAFGALSECNFPCGIPIHLSVLKRRRRTPPPVNLNMADGSNDSIESVIAITGTTLRPPVPTASWGDDDVGDCCADSLSERLADSEPDQIPSPTSLGLHECTL